MSVIVDIIKLTPQSPINEAKGKMTAGQTGGAKRMPEKSEGAAERSP